MPTSSSALKKSWLYWEIVMHAQFALQKGNWSHCWTADINFVIRASACTLKASPQACTSSCNAPVLAAMKPSTLEISLKTLLHGSKNFPIWSQHMLKRTNWRTASALGLAVVWYSSGRKVSLIFIVRLRTSVSVSKTPKPPLMLPTPASHALWIQSSSWKTLKKLGKSKG
jgi:hypothetical protein